MATIDVTHFTDPGCPWAYSAAPHLTLLRWRYADQLRWRLVTIGLTDDASQYESRGYTAERMALGHLSFRRLGMPFSAEPKAGVAATGRACRALVAVRLAAPEREDEAFRALQRLQFLTGDRLDDDAAIARALGELAGLDATAVVGRLDDPEVVAAYEADKAEARTAEGGPTAFQGKAANSDGKVRFTAPSLVFTTPDGRSLEAGGFQPMEAYDVCLANLDASLDRRGPAENAVEALRAFPHPLATREVTALLTTHLGDVDDGPTEEALTRAAAEGSVRRAGAGQSALWSAVS